MQQKHSNQHIKRAERQRDVEFARKRIKAGIIIARLSKAAAGKLNLSKCQLDASKILLDKAVPSLQAIETTNTDPLLEMDDEQLREMVKALITANPWLLEEFKPGVKPAESSTDEVNAVADSQQTQRTIANSG